MQYFDKNGVLIKAGMTIRMEDGSLELSMTPQTPTEIPTSASMPPTKNISKGIPFP